MRSAWLRPPLPRSLRGQLTLTLAALAALVVAGSATAIHALRTSARTTRALAEERLVRVQEAQELVERALRAERGVRALLDAATAGGVRAGHADLVHALEALDGAVGRLAAAGDDVLVLDLHRSSQLFRSTAHVVAGLRDAELEARARFAASLQARSAPLLRRGGRGGLGAAALLFRLRDVERPDEVEALREAFARAAAEAGVAPAPGGAADRGPDGDPDRARARARDGDRGVAADADATEPSDPFAARLALLDRTAAVRRFHDALERETVALVGAANAVSANLSGEYREAVTEVADETRANEQRVAAFLVVGLVLAALAWRYLVVRVLDRLQAVSDAIRLGASGEESDPPRVPVYGEDELGEMARAVERFLEDRARLAETNRELEAFSYSVSHDLRAPLRHVDGFATLLRRRLGGTLDPQSRHYLDAISEAGRRMGTLVDGLLSFLHLRRARLASAPVDLGAVVRDAVTDLAEEAAGRDVAFTLADLPVVEGDREMLRAALRHVLSNALKFTRPRARAEIEVGLATPRQGAEAVVFVRDNGVGFDMRHADKLFRVFHRLHRAEDFGGAGIGLANVRRIVERHGGRTWAEGAPDGGATFYLALPRRRDEPAPSRARAPAA